MDDPIMEGAKAAQESAKAVQEVAKASGQAIEATREGVGYLARPFGGTMEQAVGILEDRLYYIRWERRLRLLLKGREFALARGLPEQTKRIPLNVLVPLLEAGTSEEDDELQDVWARMLVNATDAENEFEVRRAYVSILTDCTRLDVRILAMVYHDPDLRGKPVCAEFLPDEARPRPEGPRSEREKAAPDVERSLWNLRRLGLIVPALMFLDGGERLVDVSITPLGISLVEACTLSDVAGVA